MAYYRYPLQITLFIIYIIICGCGYNQNSKLKDELDNNIVIKINVSEPINLPKTIKVVVFFELPLPLYANQDNYKEYSIKLTKGQHKIEIKTETDIAYIKFFDCSKEINGKPFMIEGGDSCQLNIHDDTYNLTLGNIKSLSLQNEIFNISKDIFQGHSHMKPEYNEFFIHYRDSMKNVVNRISAKYKNDLSSELLNLIKLNTLSQIDLSYANIVYSVPAVLSENKYAAYIRCLKKLLSEFKNRSDFEIRNSYNYASYGTKLISTYCLFTNYSVNNAIDSTYQFIKQEYSGLLRDKMLCIFFNSKSKTADWNNLMKDAASIIKDTIYRLSVKSLVNTLKQGSRAYEFKLLSNNGKYYTLDDFKGKVIVCHLWFYGCHGCSLLSKAFRTLEQKYYRQQHVVFININVDVDTARWHKGLASELYTGPSEINLSIGERGWSDEMLTYYGYFGYPQVLLVDKKGNIISANPYISSYSMDGLKNMDALIMKYAKKEDNTLSSF